MNLSTPRIRSPEPRIKRTFIDGRLWLCANDVLFAAGYSTHHHARKHTQRLPAADLGWQKMAKGIKPVIVISKAGAIELLSKSSRPHAAAVLAWVQAQPSDPALAQLEALLAAINEQITAAGIPHDQAELDLALGELT